MLAEPVLAGLVDVRIRSPGLGISPGVSVSGAASRTGFILGRWRPADWGRRQRILSMTVIGDRFAGDQDHGHLCALITGHRSPIAAYGLVAQLVRAHA